ncbi:MAG TPA: hypothetical protein VIJ19_01160 [Opitutaceae bacterium]
MSSAPFRFLVCSLVLLAPAALRAEPAVVGLARAYLGPESTLEGMTSIHFIGTLDRVDSSLGDKGTIHTDLDMVFVKPLRQRLVVRAPKVTMTTVLDGYDAWDWLQDNADPKKFRLTWLQAAEVRTLRANTWENLYYYRAPEGGSVEDMGPATIDGVECERVDFTHGPGIVYQRYFDRDTGRLVLTVRGPETFRESGEIRADGIRFPKIVVSRAKTASGAEIVSTATFEKVILNEKVSDDLFAAPSTDKGPAAGK